MREIVITDEVRFILDRLELAGIPYLLSGSRALTFLNREPHDIDIEISEASIQKISIAFPQTNLRNLDSCNTPVPVPIYRSSNIEFFRYPKSEWPALYERRKYIGKYTLADDLHIITKKIEMIRNQTPPNLHKHLSDIEFILTQLT